ncbi:MFS transporter [Saxibacter everestensis]|uniref:MFS transporter n=1 Tax=Saxibacter everestensis TaxID=2909229 RepID=A0ABY8QRG6_9MICO|nr:MFS transporter [Brevibacteriaceae bacterium ZFBP1038]
MTIDKAVKGTNAATERLYRKVTRRILPLLLICYIFAYLDRVNIGFAKLEMAKDIGLSEAAYGLGAGLFFLGYVIFEVPSNLLLQKIGTKKTIFRIMILWGATSASMMFVKNETAFYIVRFLLGIFEAGFAPGIIFYLTYWYSTKKMAGAMAIIMLAGPIGSMFGGPVSGFIIGRLHVVGGLAGWQWMFLLEGIPCIILAFLVWKFLDDGPDKATWLTPEEKQIIAAEVRSKDAEGSHSFAAALRDPVIYLMAIGYFSLISGIYAVSFWLPTILSENGVTDITTIGLYSAVPYIFAIIFMIWIAKRSDAKGERTWHVIIPAILAGLGLTAAALLHDQFFVSFAAIILATTGLWVSYTVFWAMPSERLKGTAAAGGIALINSIGLLGGFVSPYVIGLIKESTGSTQAGLMTMVGFLLIGVISLFISQLPALKHRIS